MTVINFVYLDTVTIIDYANSVRRLPIGLLAKPSVSIGRPSPFRLRRFTNLQCHTSEYPQLTISRFIST